jgi:hypothetical protein
VLRRYFSYQSYIFTNGSAITGLADHQIKPRTGKNPYSDRSARPEEVKKPDRMSGLSVEWIDNIFVSDSGEPSRSM